MRKPAIVSLAPSIADLLQFQGMLGWRFQLDGVAEHSTARLVYVEAGAKSQQKSIALLSVQANAPGSEIGVMMQKQPEGQWKIGLSWSNAFRTSMADKDLRNFVRFEHEENKTPILIGTNKIVLLAKYRSNTITEKVEDMLAFVAIELVK